MTCPESVRMDIALIEERIKEARFYINDAEFRIKEIKKKVGL